MKKPKSPLKLTKPQIKRPFNRAAKADKKVDAALSNVPRITNDTVSDHREEVLRSARKYIYPLQQSKHRVVRISIILFTFVVLGFFAYIGLSLYKFQSTSGFTYAITQVIPFPAAKAGDKWVSYESYLFELRRNMHYYQTQQQANFKTKNGQNQLDRLQKQAMNQVVRDAYVKTLAERNGVSVSGRDVDNQLAIVRSENRLGSNDRVFKEVLKEFWNWDEGDFRRELRQQLLQQAVAKKLDTTSRTKATAALTELKSGADFAAVALKYSDDQSTKGAGGAFPQAIASNERDIAPALTQELSKLKVNEISSIVDAGYSLEILKVTEKSASSLRAAHIQITLQPIETYLKPVQDKNPSRAYIKV